MKNELVKTKEKETGAPSIRAQVQELLSIITAFSSLLVKETEALKQADFKTVDTLQKDKKLFAKQYEAKVSALAGRRDELSGLDLALREKLMQERARFNTVLNDNMYALELAQNSTKRLVNRILEAARNAVVEEHKTHYSSSGTAVASKSSSMSLSVNHNL